MMKRFVSKLVCVASVVALFAAASCDDGGETTSAATTTGEGAAGAAGGSGAATGGSGAMGGSDPAGGSGGGSDCSPPVDLVTATITGEVLLGNNYGQQFDDLFGASFGSGSQMSRLRLFARFCEDEACACPVALTAAVVDGADDDGYYVYSTASNSGEGVSKKAFTIPEAPVGEFFMQLVGDTQRSETEGKGQCSELGDCPGDADVLQMEGFQITGDPGLGSENNPAPWAQSIAIDAEGATVELDGLQYLGHIYFSGDDLWFPTPSDTGKLIVATSNAADTFRNYVAIVELEGASDHDGEATDDSYTLQMNGADFAGDICTMIAGDDELYAVGIHNDGAYFFRLDSAAGTQLSDTPVAGPIPSTDPGNPNTFPRPCRGVFANKGGKDHLYLLHFQGAGASTTQSPYGFYYVNATDGTFKLGDDPGTPDDSLFTTDYTGWAWRGLVINSAGTKLFASDMDWSSNCSNDSGCSYNRLIEIPINADGVPGDVTAVEQTAYSSNEQCGSTNNWPSGLAMLTLGGNERLVMGYNDGVVSYDPSDLTTAVQVMDLTTGGGGPAFGQLFTQVEASPDGTTFYALPQCKTTQAAAQSDQDWVLPAGAGTEGADKNLVAILEDASGQLAIKSTTIDINENGVVDNGIDLDYFHLKAYIRTFGTTLPIPPVVFTGPQIVVGDSMLFLRGSGVQGNGGGTMSSSGLGQVQDVAFFDLSTGDGFVFRDYMPFFDSLSSDAGTGTGIWGYDFVEGKENSVGWIQYLPGN